MSATVLVSFAAQLIALKGGFKLGLTPEQAVILLLMVWGMITLMLSITMERRFWISAVAYIVAFLVAARYPDWRYFLMSVSHFVFTINVVAIWRPGQQPAAER
jgi:hypothetical protein